MWTDGQTEGRTDGAANRYNKDNSLFQNIFRTRTKYLFYSNQLMHSFKNTFTFKKTKLLKMFVKHIIKTLHVSVTIV